MVHSPHSPGSGFVPHLRAKIMKNTGHGKLIRVKVSTCFHVLLHTAFVVIWDAEHMPSVPKTI